MMLKPYHLTTLTACAALLLALPPSARAAAKRPPAKTAKKTAKAVAPKLVSIGVAPETATLIGPRAEQGLVVTGKYSDGTLRDLTDAAKYAVSNPRVIAVRVEESRRAVRPVADGPASVTIVVPGAPAATVKLQVKDTGQLAPVSFKDEVVPALTKLGCSQGICHGTPTGKGGFRLSLQGYAPDLDYQTLVHEGNGRRINKADPGRSLVLLKPMVQIPHGGGQRLTPDMPEFQVLTRWIAEGANDDPKDAPTLTRVEVLPGERTLKLPRAKMQVVAMAHFSDGTVRDVTNVAKLSSSNEDLATVSREGLVEATGRGNIAVLVRYQYALQSLPVTILQDVPGFRWSNPPASNYIDKLVFDRIKLFQIPASGLSSDSEFVRRAYLDTVGLLPKPEETRKFLTDTSPDKRAKLIDALTQRPEFADFWALKWADVLRIQDETMQENGARQFHDWIRDSIAQNRPMDQFVRDMLTATGSSAPANYFKTAETPEALSESTSQLFFGVRMNCAKCHNHPFERWTQDEYYELAAFFSGVKHDGGQVTWDPNAEVRHQRTGAVMKPKLLGAEFPKIAPGQDRRAVLAQWLTRKDNPFFAKSIVNRVWANLLGRGLVEPIDDFRDSNPSVNGPLLDALAKDFAEHDFDFRNLVRTIMNSRTYQLSARAVPLNRTDTAYFSHAYPRLMSAEALSDAISQLTGVPDEFPGYPEGTRAVQLAGTKVRTPFLKVFGRPDRNLTCECEREKDPTLFQALALISGRNIQSKLHDDEGTIARMAGSSMSDAKILSELYVFALSREPTEKEKTQWLSYIGRAKDRRQALEDLGWVLINSKEFLFRH